MSVSLLVNISAKMVPSLQKCITFSGYSIDTKAVCLNMYVNGMGFGSLTISCFNYYYKQFSVGHYKGLKLLDILSTLEANLAKKRYQKGSIYWYFVSYDKYTEEPLYSHFKLYWKTFSAPNASYSNKYLSQFFIKMTIYLNN